MDQPKGKAKAQSIQTQEVHSQIETIMDSGISNSINQYIDVYGFTTYVNCPTRVSLSFHCMPMTFCRLETIWE